MKRTLQSGAGIRNGMFYIKMIIKAFSVSAFFATLVFSEGRGILATAFIIFLQTLITMVEAKVEFEFYSTKKTEFRIMFPVILIICAIHFMLLLHIQYASDKRLFALPLEILHDGDIRFSYDWIAIPEVLVVVGCTIYEMYVLWAIESQPKALYSDIIQNPLGIQAIKKYK